MWLPADADVNVDMVVQNGVWLASVLVPDPTTVACAVAELEQSPSITGLTAQRPRRREVGLARQYAPRARPGSTA